MVRDAEQAYRRAVALIQADRWREAGAILEAWAPRHPHPALWSLLGAARYRQGDLERACEAFRTSLDLAPSQPDTRHNLAVALRDLGRPEAALTEVRRALALRPDYPAAVRLQAELTHALGDGEGAAAQLRAHLQRHPEDASAWNNLGLLHLDGDDPEAAVHCLEKALTQGEDGELHSNLGLAHLRLGHLERARNHLQTALRLAPRHPAVHNHLGLLAEAEGRFDQARRHFRDALTLAPDHPQAHANLARLALLLGRWREGWHHYRWRRSRRGRPYRSALPEDLTGRTLAIDGDQGLGDELFFLRWARHLRERGARIRYHGDPRLFPLLRRAAVVDETDPQPVDEAQAWSVGDLPALLDAEDTPAPVPLRPDPDRRAHLADALAHLPRPWIALTWEAGTPGPDRLHKRIDPAALGQALAAALDGRSATLLAVQRRPREADRQDLAAAAGRPVHDLAHLHDDLDELLALMDLADAYVTVSNTALHLRAGLDRPAHVLVPHPPEWRWGTDGASPWFPQAEVHRQGADGTWEAALEGLAKGLRQTGW